MDEQINLEVVIAMEKPKKSGINYDTISFNDSDDNAPDTEICGYCGSETDDRIGYNEKEDLLKRACSNCGIVYVEDAAGKITIIEGEPRDWQDYLEKHLVLPFDAKVFEDDSDPFNPFDKPGPVVVDDIVSVEKVEFDDDMYGIIVKVKKGRKKHTSNCAI